MLKFIGIYRRHSRVNYAKIGVDGKTSAEFELEKIHSVIVNMRHRAMTHPSTSPIQLLTIELLLHFWFAAAPHRLACWIWAFNWTEERLESGEILLWHWHVSRAICECKLKLILPKYFTLVQYKFGRPTYTLWSSFVVQVCDVGLNINKRSQNLVRIHVFSLKLKIVQVRKTAWTHPLDTSFLQTSLTKSQTFLSRTYIPMFHLDIKIKFDHNIEHIYPRNPVQTLQKKSHPFHISEFSAKCIFLPNIGALYLSERVFLIQVSSTKHVETS